jgi:hypothetical protein
MLKDLLLQKKDNIVKKWLKEILDTYPAETSRFLQKEKDRFHNPLGYTISQEIKVLYDELFHVKNSDKLFTSLDNILKIKAVQEFSPSQAITFIYLLKKVIRKECITSIRKDNLFEELLEVENKIDKIALYSFDIYMKYRERLYKIKVNEVKRGVSSFLKRSKLVYEIPDEQLNSKEGNQYKNEVRVNEF